MRFLSVGPVDEVEESEGEEEGKTTTIVHPGPEERPAITLSGPKEKGELEVEGGRITEVKATIESMLGRRRSFGDLGEATGTGRVITPTARPPTEEEEFVVE